MNRLKASDFNHIAADGSIVRFVDAPSTLNTSGLRPLTRRVLVLRDEVADKIGAIFIPDSVKEKEKWATVNGTLIAAGPLAWAEDRHDANLYGVPHGIPEPGARVKVGKYTGDNHEGADGKLYTIMNDTDVIAAIETEK